MSRARKSDDDVSSAGLRIEIAKVASDEAAESVVRGMHVLARAIAIDRITEDRLVLSPPAALGMEEGSD